VQQGLAGQVLLRGTASGYSYGKWAWDCVRWCPIIGMVGFFLIHLMPVINQFSMDWSKENFNRKPPYVSICRGKIPGSGFDFPKQTNPFSVYQWLKHVKTWI
jgi:hypothetical protein